MQLLCLPLYFARFVVACLGARRLIVVLLAHDAI